MNLQINLKIELDEEHLNLKKDEVLTLEVKPKIKKNSNKEIRDILKIGENPSNISEEDLNKMRTFVESLPIGQAFCIPELWEEINYRAPYTSRAVSNTVIGFILGLPNVQRSKVQYFKKYGTQRSFVKNLVEDFDI